MVMFTKVRRILTRYFAEMRWYTIVLALIFYGVTSWILLFLVGEKDLLVLSDFLYWLVVTGSTVGYGDISPTTPAGKYIVSFYVIPVGLSIFALVIGRIAAWVSEQWRKGVRGLKTLDVKDHILVIGWNEQRTVQLLNLLLKEKIESDNNPDIVLCVRVDIENPMPGLVEFVKVHSFNRDDEMDRASISDASVIILDNPEDDLTMTTALYCSQRNPDANIIAYFKDESLVGLLQQHCPNVECTPSVAVEMLAKSAFDPGSSMLHYDLLTVQDGQAQYSVTLPENIHSIEVSTLFFNLKQHYDATLIGYVSAAERHQVKLNPKFSELIKNGDKVFYIATQRLKQIDWQLLAEK
jgi:voltage-gated potassium channel